MSYFTDSNNNFNSGLSFETSEKDKILSNTVKMVERFTGKMTTYFTDDSLPTGEYRIYNSNEYVEQHHRHEYTIRIGVSSINSKTSIERAMSEIFYGSDYQNAKDWASDESYKIKNKDWQRQAYEINLESYETLNQIRCQDAIGKQYVGTGERITKEDIERQSQFPSDEILNPVQALKARQMGVDLTDSKKFDNETMDYYVNKAKGLSKIGLSKLSKSFYNKVVAPWLLANLKKIENEEPPEPETQDGDGDNDSDDTNQDGQSESNSDDGEESDSDDSDNSTSGNGDQDSDEEAEMQSEAGLGDDGDDIDEGNSVSQEGWDAREELNSIEDNTVSDQTQHSNDDHTYDKDLNKDCDGMSSQTDGTVDWDDLDDLSDEDLKAGTEEFNKVEEALYDNDYSTDKNSIDYSAELKNCRVEKGYNPQGSIHPVNNMLVRQLSKTFEKILQSSGEDNAPEGSELDINAFIDSRVDGRPEIFIQEEDTNEFEAVIGVDLSSSMSGEKIKTCKDICANLLESIKSIPRVKVKIIGWTGNDSRCRIIEANNRKDLAGFEASSLTPMAKGMIYCKNTLEKMQGTRKVMFFLTDGYPNDNSDIAIVKQCVNEMRGKRYSVLGIGIGMDKQSCDSAGIFGDMFGKGFIACPTVQEVERVLRQDFVKEVSKFLRC